MAIAVAALASCVKEVPAPKPNPRPDVDVKKDTVLAPISFQAQLGESRCSNWDAEALIYDNVAKHGVCAFEATQISGLRATLIGEAYDPADMYYALYPSTAFGAFHDGKACRDIPVNQAVKAEGDELAPEAQVAFAQAMSTELKFSPVASYVSFDVKAAEVVSFTLHAAGDEDIAGQTEIDVFGNEVSLIGGEKTISVTAEGKEMFESKTYAVEILPGEYKNGFAATLTFKDGSTYVNTFPEAVEIGSGDVINVGNITDLSIYAPVVKVDAAAFTDAKISWEKVETADGYKVYSNGALLATLGADALSYKVNGLANESTNTIKVEAYNERKSASTEVTATTKGIRKSTQSTGTTFLCIDWDSILRTRLDGKEQAYQVQICEDQACTKVIYDFVPHTGQKQTNPVFGNSSYYGRTTQLQDGISCANILTPTRVSIGGFYPATTYYVRIRTLASAVVKNCTTQGGAVTEATITNAFGTSEWSEAVAMTTDSERTPDPKVLFYTGFNDFCSQTDYKGFAPGAVPFCFPANKAVSACYIPWNHPDRDKSMGFTFYCAGDGQHQTNTFNFTKNGAYVNGATTENGRTYLVGRPKGEVNAITGDVDGWHFCQWCRPFMGMCGIDGSPVSIATPNIKAGQVSAEGDPCSISFTAVARVRPDDNYAGTLKVRVWRAATKTFEEIGVVPTAALLPYPEGSPKDEFKADFTGHKHTFTATLKVGDAVELMSTAAGIILVDDVLVTRGINIDNVDRDEIEW